MRELRWIATVSAGARVATATGTPARTVGGPTLPAGDADLIRNRRILPPKDFSTARPNSFGPQFGGHVDHIYAAALNAFRVTLSGRDAKRSAADPAAGRVGRDRVARLAATRGDTPSRDLDDVEPEAATRGDTPSRSLDHVESAAATRSDAPSRGLGGASATPGDVVRRSTGKATSPGKVPPNRLLHRAAAP